MAEYLEHYRNQIVIARTEIKNLRLQLAALKQEHQKEIKLINSTLKELRCAQCSDIATTVSSNHKSKPSTSTNEDGINYRPIGVIETTFQNKRGVPRQPSVLSQAKGVVVINPNVFNNPEHALYGLEEFSHMWIIFHFHATESTNVPAKVAPPRLGGERRGVFSTRSPHRPCPIGLSLVKIEGIEGNKIHFLGVDMVNGTPVLDIKPYIPQYDSPLPNDTPMSLVRPPTEGISDATEIIANVQLNDDNYDTRSLSPQVANISTNNSRLRSEYEEEISPIDTENVMIPTPPSLDSPSSIDMLDGNSFPASLLSRPDTERGAPDGQERFTPPQSTQLVNFTDGIRVAPWISNPPAQTFNVIFTDDTLARLNELLGDRVDGFKTNIECLLSEDPRSHYVRSRYPDHEYSCVLEDVSISCVFNANSSVCTIVAVRNAEEMQET